jgi:hypothetical protein
MSSVDPKRSEKPKETRKDKGKGKGKGKLKGKPKWTAQQAHARAVHLSGRHAAGGYIGFLQAAVTTEVVVVV